MKKLFIIMISCLFMITSCKEQRSDNSTNISNNDGGNEMKKVLNISFYDDGIRLNDIEAQAKLFEKQHKDIEIKFNSVNESDKYKLKISTALMSETADDIIDCLFLDYYKIADSGKIVDFNEIMNNDTLFNKDDYYINILDAFSYNGGIYLFPAQFTYWLVGANQTISSEFLSKFKNYNLIDNLDMIKLYNSLENKNKYYVEQSFSVYNVIFNQILKYVDFENKTCNFKNDEFVELITYAKSINSEDNKDFIGHKTWGVFTQEEESSMSDSYVFQEINPLNYQYFLPYEHKYFSSHIPVKNGSGKIEVSPIGGFFISKNSSNKELAWEFIKFLSSYSGITNNILSSMILNKDACIVRTENMLNLKIRELEQLNIYLNDDIRQDIYNSQISHNASTEKPKCITEAIETISSINQQPMSFTNWFGLLDIIQQEVEPFMNDISTAEQVANGLQNKVFLYLNE